MKDDIQSYNTHLQIFEYYFVLFRAASNVKKYRRIPNALDCATCRKWSPMKKGTGHAIVQKYVMLVMYANLEKTVHDLFFWTKLYILVKSG